MTRSDNQEVVSINVYQGESNKMKNNIFLDRFKVHGIPPAHAGEQTIKVCFKIDINGILSVSAKVKSTGNKKSITIDVKRNMPQDRSF